MEGLSFTSPVMLKLFIALFVYIFHLFTVCFLLTKINKQVSEENIHYCHRTQSYHKTMILLSIN